MEFSIRRLNADLSFLSLPPGKIMADNRGFALAVVLGVSVILMIIASGITAQVRTRIRMAQELEDRAKAFCKVRSGYSTVMYNFLRSTFKPYAIKIHKSDGSFEEWNLFGDPISLDTDVTVTLRDTAGMIPLLHGDKFLRKFVSNLTSDSRKAAEFADAFMDWQDEDPFKRLNGAESWEYRAAGYEYEPRNFYIQMPQEIKLIIGFDPEIYEKFINSVTYVSSVHANYLTMDRQTLGALIPGKELVDEIVDLREKKVLTPSMFRNMTGIPTSLSVMYYPANKIVIRIGAEHGKSVDTICAVVEKKENETAPFQILEWRK
jgi:general secretion pathway protein K